ncbi:hypothetical protein SLEP1_g38054 [Rubroshorea leprosula]|uniref:Uncharacterized protein n=1 Tax=Rubroshorea leprosula TaxID=152421 RepID=A0AAV5KWW3_9ROSI|nr:hypothetical protein SLEP1_g38054 [Rubroshorea leprosula]
MEKASVKMAFFIFLLATGLVFSAKAIPVGLKCRFPIECKNIMCRPGVSAMCSGGDCSCPPGLSTTKGT